MILNIVKKLIPFTLIIGTIGIGIYFILGTQPTYLKTYTVSGYTIYGFDIRNYLLSLQNYTKANSYLKLEIPNTPQFDFTDVLSSFRSIWNGILMIVNFFITGINILIYPIRFIAYIIGIILAVIGFEGSNIGNNNVFQTFLGLSINYIQYI